MPAMCRPYVRARRGPASPWSTDADTNNSKKNCATSGIEVQHPHSGHFMALALSHRLGAQGDSPVPLYLCPGQRAGYVVHGSGCRSRMSDSVKITGVGAAFTLLIFTVGKR